MAIADQTPSPGMGDGIIRTALRTLAGAAGLCVLLYAPIGEASAQAPIVFASAGKSNEDGGARYQKLASAPLNTASITSKSNRVEYRYPDQPDMVFGEFGTRKISNAGSPMAFSSSEAAIDVAAARRISGVASVQPASKSSAKGYAVQKVGSPYQIKGRWYVPAEEPDYDETGVGSWYGPKFHGRKTATGEKFNMNEMTAAHTTLPIPSLARVTNLENGRSIVVRINDRGPFIDNRIIDLSKKAAETIGYQEQGKAKVRVQYLGRAPAEHNTLPAQYVAENQRVAYQAGKSAKQSPRPQQQSLQKPKGYGEFHLQAGSFSELGNAHALRAKLQGLAPVVITEARVGGRDYFRVMLGPWPSKPAAEEAKQRLTGHGVDTIIVAAK